MKAVLGIDTSCYTTSAALVTLDGDILASERKLLTVQEGKRGLMQSEMVFQHVNALPERIRRIMDAHSDIRLAAVSASTRPRPAEESYMPAFRAGESQARTVATLLRVPFYPFSHQEGHVRAALVGTDIDREVSFLALHLSGGTTELLRCGREGIVCIGGSLDLHAGQLVDRVGVRMGLPFPCGPRLEQLAKAVEPHHLLKVSMRGLSCSLSGAEAECYRLLEKGLPREQAAAEIYDLLSRSIARMLSAASEETGIHQALLAGGVASSGLLRGMLLKRLEKQRIPVKATFARPELAGDNAVGTALLGAERFQAEHSLGQRD